MNFSKIYLETIDKPLAVIIGAIGIYIFIDNYLFAFRMLIKNVGKAKKH